MLTNQILQSVSCCSPVKKEIKVQKRYRTPLTDEKHWLPLTWVNNFSNGC